MRHYYILYNSFSSCFSGYIGFITAVGFHSRSNKLVGYIAYFDFVLEFIVFEHFV